MNNLRVHFMGIGGSGMSAVAFLAYRMGFKISGCDLLEDTPYLKKLKKLNVPIFIGHNSNHLKNVDILAITPAAYFQSKDHPEIAKGRKEAKVLTWQKFLGKYLQKDKKVICISGTHGKSTTTAMASLIFEKAGLDPTVMIGATIKEWGSNARIGKSEIFITESDEFYNNFLNYSPDTIILNNIEYDHPDYFKSEKQLLTSFTKHVKSLTGSKTLIFNQDSLGIYKLFKIMGKKYLMNLNLIGYTLKDKPLIPTKVSIRGENIDLKQNETVFEISSSKLNIDGKFKLRIPGTYNVSNALGVVTLAKLNNVPVNKIKKFLFEYQGIGRRMDLIGEKNKITVYEDYAHHPTAIRVTLEAFNQKYPKRRIWAVIEPHSYSRTKALLPKYENCFNAADCVVIAPVFKARDKRTFGISGQSIVEISNHSFIRAFRNFNKVKKFLKKNLKSKDVVVIMGAGNSYQYAREIFKDSI